MGLCGVLAAESSAIWLDVPFVKQNNKDGCGAASVAMVIQYWRRQEGGSGDLPGAAEIERALPSGTAHGTYASAIERYFRRNGYQVFAFRAEWADLKQHIEKGRPLIVALKPGAGRPNHYLVVAGVDWEHGFVFVNDPAERKLLKRDRATFEREWDAVGRWTLLAIPEADAH